MSRASSWSPEAIRESWDPRADRYLALFRDELDGKPFDRGVFEAFASRLEGKGLVADVGRRALRVGEDPVDGEPQGPAAE